MELSKQGIFIATHDTITSSDLAQLFVIHVFSKHGVPAHMTCDRGSEFISHFFRLLGTALDMKLHFTSGYHPEGDGQTERTNQSHLCNFDASFTGSSLGELCLNNGKFPWTASHVK